ncbi:MAG: succinate dehydrogenase cytochrome b subunit [Cyclobacteriaceae bacterium]
MSLFLRKSIIAGSGLFLCVFLIVHLSANCILLLPESIASDLYNSYSTTLRENPLIKLVAYALYLSIILHVVYAAIVTYINRKAKPDKYIVNHAKENSSFASQNMGWLGILILIFIVIHLANFWARIKLGIGESVGLDSNGNVDVYDVTYSLFQNGYYVLFYSILAIPLGYHLNHGLKSGFKTLGFYHKKGLRILAKVSLVYALIISAGFGIIPIIVYFK